MIFGILAGYGTTADPIFMTFQDIRKIPFEEGYETKDVWKDRTGYESKKDYKKNLYSPLCGRGGAVIKEANT